jgi:hypothetical protein
MTEVYSTTVTRASLLPITMSPVGGAAAISEAMDTRNGASMAEAAAQESVAVARIKAAVR